MRKSIYTTSTMIFDGDEFLSLGDARKAIQVIDDGQLYKVYKSDSKRHIIICMDDDCPFHIGFMYTEVATISVGTRLVFAV